MQRHGSLREVNDLVVARLTRRPLAFIPTEAAQGHRAAFAFQGGPTRTSGDPNLEGSP
jgi:hypothetical protein